MKTWKRMPIRPSLSLATYRNLPKVIVCLSYSQIYDDFSRVDPKNFLRGIPTFDLLLPILNYENQIHYCLHDPEFDEELLAKICKILDSDERVRMIKSINKHKNLTLINSEGTLRFVRLALSCFTPEKKDFELNEGHLKNIFKAYLYCNQIWTNECVKVNHTTFPHVNQAGKGALIDISLKLDIPYSEFKYFKDYRTQLYKAIKLFEFAENNKLFKPILEAFYKDRKVESWKDYVRIHFGFFDSSLKSPVINMQGAPEAVVKFIEPYLVDQTKISTDDNLQGQMPSFLRTQFLLNSTNNPDLIMVLSPDLLVDKIFQGLKFDFYNIAVVNGIKDGKGKEITQKRINSELGYNFSEEKILYSAIDMIYGNRTDLIRKSGSDTKDVFEKCGKSEPDYYLRKGQNLILFENKDVLFPDKDKYSGQLLKLKQSITTKIAKYGMETRDNGKAALKKEGLGQIYYNIARMKDKPDLYRSFDPEFDLVKRIYPVLITYDKAYSAIGVNEYINKKVPTIKKRVLKHFKDVYHHEIKIGGYDIQKSVIIDIDTLIMYALELKKQKLDLIELIDEYISKVGGDEPNLPSFYMFMLDHHKLDAQGEEFVKMLYGDILEKSVDDA